MAARASDKYIPLYIVLFFVVQVGVFSWFLHIAYSSFTGVVTEDAYNKGLRYNDTLAQARAQEKLGWTLAVEVRHKTAQDVVFTATLKDARRKALEGATLMLWLTRPVQAGMDQRLTMSASGPGVYTASAVLSARGLWEVRVEAVKGGDRFQVSSRKEL